MKITFQIGEIEQVAAQVWEQIQNNPVVAFHGNMGAGKTTFIQQLCKQAGVKDTMSSPTFSIINEYRSPAGSIYHMDLYRLNSEVEAQRAGVEEYLFSGARCFVEWPEKAPGIFPDETLHVTIDITNDGSRVLQIQEN